MAVYVLVAIVQKRLQLSRSLYEILQILSLILFTNIGTGLIGSVSGRSQRHARA